MASVKYLTEARLFAPAANKWASDSGLMNENGGILTLLGSNNLSDLSDTTQARINLGLRINADVQAYSSNLTSWASAGQPSPFTLSLVTKSSSTEWRTAIGAGTVNSVALSGGNTGLLFTGGPIVGDGTITLDGTLSIEHGGTGASSITELKTGIGLGNVDNTSDLNKPISTATQSALDGKYNNPTGGVTQFIRGDGSLGNISDITGGQSGSGTVTSVDISGGTTGLSFSGGPITNNGILTLTGTLGFANGGTGATSLSSLKLSLGINNVDNTSDANKPISIAVQEALDEKASNSTATINVTGLMAAADKAKLDGIESNATANDTNTNLKNRANHTGTQSADTLTEGTTNKLFSVAEKTKLTGIATGATVNDSDANLRNRATHTGTQAISTITNLQSTLDGKETFLSPGNSSQYYRGDKTWQTLSKAAVGLENVDNTSDLNKPVSQPTQMALDALTTSLTAIQEKITLYNTLLSFQPVSVIIHPDDVGEIHTLTTTLSSPTWSKAYGSMGIEISSSGVISIDEPMDVDTSLTIIGRLQVETGVSIMFTVDIICMPDVPVDALLSAINGEPLFSAIDGDYITSANV